MDKISCELIADRIACGECGQVHHVKAVKAGYHALCTRCGATLYRKRSNMFETTLALAITGLILFSLTNWFPLLKLRTQGITQEITLWKACFSFWHQNFYLFVHVAIIHRYYFSIVSITLIDLDHAHVAFSVAPATGFNYLSLDVYYSALGYAGNFYAGHAGGSG